MFKQFRFFLCVLAMSFMVSVTLADTEEKNGITWSYSIIDGEARVDGASVVYFGTLNIPSRLGNCPVTHISGGAFANRGDITGVTIPERVSRIGYRAFYGCSWLRSVTIPSSVMYIESYAFYGCSWLRSVTIPGSVIQIAEYTFYGCGELTSVTISDGVKSIGKEAFGDCGLTSLEIPKSVISIGESAFEFCRDLKSVMISDGLTSIGDYAFYGCSWLRSVTIPESVTDIGKYAFYGCSMLTSVTIPTGVTSIAEHTFTECRELVSASIPEGVTNVGCGAFSDCIGLTSITIPKSVKRIEQSAFASCRGLTSLTIRAGVTHIGNSAFSGCRGLMALEIPPSVIDIENAAFRDCYDLASMSIPEGVMSIGVHAFLLSDLTSVSIPASVTNIGTGAFGHCIKLARINVDSANKDYCSIDGLLCNKDATELICCPGGVMSVTIPSSVTSIGDEAFCDSIFLTSVAIPLGVDSIGRSAFESSSLVSVTIPSSVTSIGSLAFYSCELAVVYVDKGDVERVKKLYRWTSDVKSDVKFVEINPPAIEDDEGATVTGDAETGFVIKPSEGKTAVEVSIPQGVDAAKVTVEVSPKVTSVKPNGAKVKIASGGADITEFLNVPAADGNGIVDLTKATVKEEIVKEAMDPEKGAEIKLDAANPTLITPNTRVGLFYQLREGTTLEGMSNGDSTIGDGNPWKPEIKVKGGNSAFYSIGVGKGE